MSTKVVGAVSTTNEVAESGERGGGEDNMRSLEGNMSTFRVSEQSSSSTMDSGTSNVPVQKRTSTSNSSTSSGSTPVLDGDTTPRTSVLMELTDRVGVLHDVLRYFWKYDINICRIESRPAKERSLGQQQQQHRAFDFFVDLEGSPSDENVGKVLNALRYVTSRT
jgi:prephenate dehydratase